MAASHVTGLAALVLAHLPDFQGLFKARNADRVERLFQVLRASARPVYLGDPRRTGFGMPDVLVALGMAPPMQPVPGVFPNLFANAGMFGALGFRQPLGFSHNATAYPHAQVPVGTW